MSFARPLDVTSPRALRTPSRTPTGRTFAAFGPTPDRSAALRNAHSTTVSSSSSAAAGKPAWCPTATASSPFAASSSRITTPRGFARPDSASTAAAAGAGAGAYRSGVAAMSSPLPRIATATTSRYHRERESTPAATKAFPPGTLERCGQTGSIFYVDTDGRVCVDKLIASLEEVCAVLTEAREAETAQLHARAQAAAAAAAAAAGFTAVPSVADGSDSSSSSSSRGDSDPLSAAALALDGPTTVAPQLVILVVSGAFAPVHRAHTALLDTAQAAVEAGGEQVVVARYLNVASDTYMRTKVPNKDQQMPLEERVRMAEIAVQQCPLTAVCPYGWVSAERAADKLRYIATRIVAETPVFAEALAPEPVLTVVQVCGANAALRNRLYTRGNYLAVARPGCSVDRLVSDVMQARARQDPLGPAHRFRLVDPAQPQSPYPPVPPCSSTRIRDLVCRAGGPREAELRALGWLEEAVADYLIQSTERFHWLCRH